MTTNLPPEVVEAAARAMYAARYPRFEWDDENKAMKGLYRDRARVALSAALPLLPGQVKPSQETIARVIGDARWGPGEWVGVPDVPLLRQADAVLAVLPGRTEAQVGAQYLREAAEVLKDGMNASAHFNYPVPYVADAVDWLEDRADRIERGEA